MRVHISELYKSIYKKFDELTPVPFDCGALCGKLCCQGDSESGMYLFPGEAKLFIGKENFSVFDTDFEVNGNPVDLVVCHGPCERDERPLSCRIFPLIPYYRKGCTLEIINDPRASICPLTHPAAEGCITEPFRKQVENTFRLLLKFPEIADYLDALSYILDEYKPL